MEIWSGVTDASQTTEYRATQLLSSIQFKLSHAISIYLKFSGRTVAGDQQEAVVEEERRNGAEVSISLSKTEKWPMEVVLRSKK